MEFKSGSTAQTSRDSKYASIANSLLLSEGESSYEFEHVIDLRLSDELPVTQTTQVLLDDTVGSSTLEPIGSLWARARTKFTGGTSIGGWYYLGEPPIEEVSSNSIDSVSTCDEDRIITDNLGDEVKQLLADTLEVFTDNAGLFREHLGELKKEAQTLPSLQGALTSLNTTVVAQRNDINDLKVVCDFSLASLVDKQKEVKDEIEKILRFVESVPKLDQDQASLNVTTDLEAILKKVSADEIETLKRIEHSLEALDLSRFLQSFETIYQISKKGVDENREISTKISESISELANRQATEIKTVSEESITNLQEEVALHLDAILRIERKFENLKGKMFLGYSIAMGVLGILLGSCLNFF